MTPITTDHAAAPLPPDEAEFAGLLARAARELSPTEALGLLRDLFNIALAAEAVKH